MYAKLSVILVCLYALMVHGYPANDEGDGYRRGIALAVPKDSILNQKLTEPLEIVPEIVRPVGKNVNVDLLVFSVSF